MAEFDVALIELGKLIGFFQASGSQEVPEGSVRWEWFGDPIGQALAAIPAQRERIGAMLRALLGADAPPAAAFNSANDWQVVFVIDDISGGFGITWTKPGGQPASEPLAIGVGANAANIGGEAVTLGVLAKLLRITGGSAEHAFGDVEFGGTFPVPDFLASGALEGSVDVDPLAVSVGLTATAPATENPPAAETARTLAYQAPGGPTPEILGWDAARLAVFVLKAFIAERAKTEDFFARVLKHVFPMLGDDPANVIAPLPVVDDMGQPADFEQWSTSVLPGQDAAGALTFLWHLRALLTGNEDPQFWPGSMFFPLIDGPDTGNPPTMADAGAQPYPPANPGAGAWVGVLTDPPDAFTLVIDVWNAASQQLRIPIAKWDGTDLTRPTFGGASLAGFGGGAVTVNPDGFTLISHTVPDGPLQGEFAIALVLNPGQPPEIVLHTPPAFPELALPPTPAGAPALAADLISTIVTFAAPGTNIEPVLDALAGIASSAIQGNAPEARDLLAAVIALAALAQGGDGSELTVPIGDDFTMTLALPPNSELLSVGAEFGPVTSEGDPPDLVIEKLKAGLSISLAGGNVLDGFQIGFENLRLGDHGEGGGIVETLFPDMAEMPGFGLLLDYSATQGVSVTGGGKIPIQRTIGPLEIAALLVDLRKDSLAIGLDLGFELGPIMVAAYELGLEVRFKDPDAGAVTPFLHGLGLSMDTDAIKLGGFFAAVDRTVDSNGQQTTITDYIGGAVVSVSGYFELSAIGGYTQLPDGDPSLFIFASLVAPLGGPPWFFMTGVAGGFGLNRALPDPGLMLEHPFLKVMRGELDVSGDAATALTKLADAFAVQEGEFWIAAGIQFISFGFITGRVVVAIAFGHKFSFTILGMASFSLEPLAYIEIGILTTVDEEKFLLRASLSPNSYILHPDIFSLQGDIALCAWYAPPHKGDFLFSIGGYHPDFKKPEHYPELVRVGAKATLYDFVHLSVEVFFACTPQALMAGAKAALWAEFMGIAAGCEVYVDVLITWDPFFIRAKLGVVLWFEFFGRHEIGVHLDIYTPDFGGTATIDLALVSFEVSFGAEIGAPPPPSIADFMANQLALPAKTIGDGARVPTFNTADDPGLLRLEFLTGRVGAVAAEESEQQEGTDPAAPVRLGPEWSFLVRTRLPLDLDPPETPPAVIDGTVNLPLTERFKMTSNLTITSPQLDDPQVAGAIGRSWLGDYHPAATFGPDPLVTGQTGTQAAAKLKSETPSVPLVEGVVVECGPQIPAEVPLTASLAETSSAAERYPLPLGAEATGSGNTLLESLAFADFAALPTSLPSGKARRDEALAALRGRSRPPLSVLAKSAGLLNAVAASAGQKFSVAGQAAGGMPRMAPPASPARSVEMQPVSLKLLPVRSDHAAPRHRLETVTRPPRFTEAALTKPDGATGRFRAAVEVPAGAAQLLEFGGGGFSAATVRMAGDQQLRTVGLDRGGRVLFDRYERGSGATKLPSETATLVLVGAGRAGAPSTAGVERDTTLLAVGPRTFLAPGCVLTARTALPAAVRALDGLPGAALFDGARRVDAGFPAQDKAGTLVIRVVPTVERPGPAERQVRWRAVGATLRDLVPVVGTDRVTLTMAVRAERPWRLEVDLGPEWRLDGVAVLPGGARGLIDQLRRGGGTELVDDAIAPGDGMVTKVNVEANT